MKRRVLSAYKTVDGHGFRALSVTAKQLSVDLGIEIALICRCFGFRGLYSADHLMPISFVVKVDLRTVVHWSHVDDFSSSGQAAKISTFA